MRLCTLLKLSKIYVLQGKPCSTQSTTTPAGEEGEKKGAPENKTKQNCFDDCVFLDRRGEKKKKKER